MSYTLSIPIILGSSQAGLTLKARLVDIAGSNVGAEITTGFVEIGLGNYLLTASIPDSHRGGIKILKSSDSSLLAFAAINPEEAENTDAKTSTRLATAGYTVPPTVAQIDTQLTSTHGEGGWGATGDDPLENPVPGDYEAGTAGAALGRIGTAKVTAVSPVSVSGDMQIIKGDDYSANDGSNRVFEWSDDEDAWPDLTDATITFRCKSVEAEAEFIEGTPNKVRLELTQTQTAALPTGRPRFSIFATLSNDHVVTLVIGSIRYVAVEGLR